MKFRTAMGFPRQLRQRVTRRRVSTNSISCGGDAVRRGGRDRSCHGRGKMLWLVTVGMSCGSLDLHVANIFTSYNNNSK